MAVQLKEEVGDELISWCTKCRLDLNHTLIAKAEKKARVRCLTCDGEHNYRAPGGPKRKTTRKTTRRSTKREIKPSTRTPRDYGLAESFSVDDVIDHTKYGRGQVIDVRGNKIDVHFEDGQKTLVHQYGS